MAARLTISAITGQSPFDFYVCDIYGNNCSLLGTVDGKFVFKLDEIVQVTNVISVNDCEPSYVALNPTNIFTLPTLFNNAPSIMIKMIDSNGCEINKILTCDLSCGFEVVINTAECVFCFEVSVDPCGFGPYIQNS